MKLFLATLNHAPWYMYVIQGLILIPILWTAIAALLGSHEKPSKPLRGSTFRDLPTRDDVAAYVHTDRRHEAKLNKIERAQNGR